MPPNCALVFIQILLLSALAASKYDTENNSKVSFEGGREGVVGSFEDNSSFPFSWRRPTANRLMKVHLFNYTNWQRVRDGLDTKFHVQDVGPYVYSQHLEREKIKVDKELLTFREHKFFEFLPEASAGADFDQVFVPNIPYLSLIARTANSSLVIRLGVSTLLNTTEYHQDTFLQLPVSRFLWGYEDTVVTILKPFLTNYVFGGQENFDQFGLLVTKNGSSANFTINTGEYDINKMNLIEEFNGRKDLPYWGSPDCNSVEASDGSIFPPSFLDRNRTLEVFFPNLCRKIPFKYVKDVELDGVNLLRYAMPRDVFDDPKHNPANQCYCQVDTGTCPPRGVFDVTQCAMGATLVSFPHFHYGDSALLEQFIGLDPNSEQSQSYIDIHPTLGVTLRGKYSLQLNIQVKKPKTSPFYFNYLPEGLVLPIAWIEMSMEDSPVNWQSEG